MNHDTQVYFNRLWKRLHDRKNAQLSIKRAHLKQKVKATSASTQPASIVSYENGGIVVNNLHDRLIFPMQITQKK